MKRKHQLILGAIIIIALIGIVSTSIESTTPKLSPSELESGGYEGEYVSLEGRATEVQKGDQVRMTVVGNTSDARIHVVVTADSTPATLQSGELVIVKGEYSNETLMASEVLVRSHEE